jgi:MFS family permease
MAFSIELRAETGAIQRRAQALSIRCRPGRDLTFAFPADRLSISHLVPPFKQGIYVLEGLNAFACSYYFNYLLFVFRDDHHFGNLENLAVGAGHGLIYMLAAWLGGRFGQRRGYFTTLRLGFGGMAAALALAAALPSLTGQLLALALWTVAMCFTWPMLEALASEHEAPATLPHRIGLYNVTWAVAAALAYFVGGILFEMLGRPSLYWLPGALYLVKYFLTFRLQQAHDRWVRQEQARATPARPVQPMLSASSAPAAVNPRPFLTLAWVANPFAYMSINTVIAVVPGIARNVGLGIAEAGMVMSVWFIVRAGVFVVLWFWHGWHYRFRWFLTAFLALMGAFVAIMLAREIWVLVVAQLFFGWATGLIYYSSLFYAMDGSETKGAHGGLHEAFLGLGIFAGPTVGAASLWLAPQSPQAAAWAVTGFLIAGLAGLIGVRARVRANSDRTAAPAPKH